MTHREAPLNRRSHPPAGQGSGKARGLSCSLACNSPVGHEPSATPKSCEDVLKVVIALAQATLLEREGAERASCVVSEQRAAHQRATHLLPSASSAAVSDSRAQPQPGAGSRVATLTAQQELARALRNLEPELALKVRTLMVAGRDGQSIHAVKIHMTLADGTASFHAAADDTCENGPLLAEYLRRGHALAHASGLDLERPIAGWAKATPGHDERDWQRFGRQLAQSHPDDWHCLLVKDAGEHGSQLYLEHPEHGTWSFHAGLDRTAPEALDGHRLEIAGPSAGGVRTRSLSALVPGLRKAKGLAVRRAALAICARVGAVA